MSKADVKSGQILSAARNILSRQGVTSAAIMTGIVDGYGMQMVIEPELIVSYDIWEAAETTIRNLIVIE